LNGRLATLSARRPLSSAAAISGGPFVAVGTDAEVMAYQGDKTQVIDVGGRTVIPGLNDSHMHPIRGIAVQHRMAFQGESFVERYSAQQAQRTPPIRRMIEMGVPVGGGYGRHARVQLQPVCGPLLAHHRQDRGRTPYGVHAQRSATHLFGGTWECGR
jgi:predicted amidohydrolase YtcJ